MTELSPKAQDVLGAAEDAYDYNYSEFHRCANSVAAATLRAVVLKCVYTDDYGNSYINSQDLLNIANELEGVPLSKVAQDP